MYRIYGKHEFSGQFIDWRPKAVPDEIMQCVMVGGYSGGHVVLLRLQSADHELCIVFQQAAFMWWDAFAPEITEPIIVSGSKAHALGGNDGKRGCRNWPSKQ